MVVKNCIKRKTKKKYKLLGGVLFNIISQDIEENIINKLSYKNKVLFALTNKGNYNKYRYVGFFSGRISERVGGLIIKKLNNHIRLLFSLTCHENYEKYNRYKPENNEELKNLVKSWSKDKEKVIEEYGDISTWNTELITSMQNIFRFRNVDYIFKQDSISQWNTSNVTDMSHMFYSTQFGYHGRDTCLNTKYVNRINNSYIAWDTSNVTNMSNMFALSSVRFPMIYDWNTSKVTNMSHMFQGVEEFDSDIHTHLVELKDSKEEIIERYTAWDTSNVTDMSFMFLRAENFNKDISNWNTKNVKKYEMIFIGASSLGRNRKPGFDG